MSTITAKCLINSQAAADVTTSYYSVSSGNTIIDKFTATNTDSGTQTITVYLIPRSGAAGASNTIIYAKSLTSKQTYDFTEIQNQILNTGDGISVATSLLGAITIRCSGREIT